MSTVEVLDDFGSAFQFEPPVEIGDHSVATLGELTAIAINGPDQDNNRTRVLAHRINDLLSAHHVYDDVTTFPHLLNTTLANHNSEHRVSLHDPDHLRFGVSAPTVKPAPKAPRPKKQFDLSNYKPELLEGKPGTLEIDEVRAYEVFDLLIKTLENNGFPYSLDHVRTPQDPRHMPKTLEYGSRDHAMLMLVSCYYMRGGIKSTAGFQRISQLYDSRPDLFQPEVAAKTSRAEFKSELRKHGLGFTNTVPAQWIKNAERLLEKYDGDPRNIFADINTYEEAVGRIKNNKGKDGFVGFKEKMTSMLCYFMMSQDLVDRFDFPVPVDLHVMRVCLANEVIKFPDTPHGVDLYSEELLATIRDLTLKYVIDKGVDPLKLSDALWLLSESMCGEQANNKTHEPLGRKNRNGRSTVLVPYTINLNDKTQKKEYDETCRPCPLSDTCEYSVPGALYYRAGALIIRGPRVRFPEEETLFDNG
jgi:hypothetical protein